MGSLKSRRVGYNFQRASPGDGHGGCGSLSLHKHCETRSCARRIDGHFRTVGLSLKFHPSAFVVRSEGREDKQVHMYKEIIQGPGRQDARQHRVVEHTLSQRCWIRTRGPPWTLSPNFFLITNEEICFALLCFFPPCVLSTHPKRKNNNKQHADPVNATRTACVSRALWIPLGSLRGDCPGELQLHQELAGGLRKQRRRHCQPEPAHLPLGRRGTQVR